MFRGEHGDFLLPITDMTAEQAFNLHVFEQPSLGEALPGQTIMRVIQGELPPEGLQPLELPWHIDRRLATSSREKEDQSFYRHDGTRGIDYAISKGQLSVVDRGSDDDALDERDSFLWGAEMVLSELNSNALLHSGGLAGVDLGRTPDGKLYVATRNLTPIYPEGGLLHERPKRRHLRFGQTAVQKVTRLSFDGSETLPPDEHQRGSDILNKVTEKRGMFQIAYPELNGIQVRKKDGVVIGHISLLQTVSWAVLGKPKPATLMFADVVD